MCLHVGQCLPLSGLLRKEGLLLAGILVATDALLKEGIEEAVELLGGRCELRFLCLDTLTCAPAFLLAPGGNPVKHAVPLLPGQGHDLAGASELCSERLLARVASLRACALLLRAVVVVVSLLAFRGHVCSTLTATNESEKGQALGVLGLDASPLGKDVLNAIEELLRYERFVRSLVQLAVVSEDAHVEWIGQHDRDSALGDHLAPVAGQSE